MSSPRKCPKCGYSTDNLNAKYCRWCGEQFGQTSKLTSFVDQLSSSLESVLKPKFSCTKCGTQKIHPNARFCKTCGNPFVIDSPASHTTSSQAHASDSIDLPSFDEIIKIAQEKKELEKEQLEKIKKEIEKEVTCQKCTEDKILAQISILEKKIENN